MKFLLFFWIIVLYIILVYLLLTQDFYILLYKNLDLFFGIYSFLVQNSKINENLKDLSNIKPLNYTKENLITLPDDSSVSYNDIITNQNSLRLIINMIKNKNEIFF